MKQLILEKLRVIGLSLLLLLLTGLGDFIPVEWWQSSVDHQMLAYAIYLVSFSFVLFVSFRKQKRYDLVPFSKTVFSWKYLGYVCLAFMVIYGINQIGFFWLEALGETTTANEQLLKEEFSKLPSLIIMMSGVIMAPIVEETIFRGLLNKIFFKRWRLVGLLTSSLLFGAAHLPTNLPSWFIYVGMGLVTAYLYDLTDDMAYPILLHMLNNGIAFLSDLI